MAEVDVSKYNMRLNDDEKRVRIVREKLNANTERYGKPYCPCMPNRTEDTVCPCRFMRELNACRCGLYVRKEE